MRCDNRLCKYWTETACSRKDIWITASGQCVHAAETGPPGRINPPWIEDALRRLRSCPGYPFDYDVDRKFLLDLYLDYEGVDLPEVIAKLSAWLFDHKQGKRGNYRLRLRNWCANAKKWGDVKKPRTSNRSKKQVVEIKEIW